jgi:hypothetical protein
MPCDSSQVRAFFMVVAVLDAIDGGFSQAYICPRVARVSISFAIKGRGESALSIAADQRGYRLTSIDMLRGWSS